MLARRLTVDNRAALLALQLAGAAGLYLVSSAALGALDLDDLSGGHDDLTPYPPAGSTAFGGKSACSGSGLGIIELSGAAGQRPSGRRSSASRDIALAYGDDVEVSPGEDRRPTGLSSVRDSLGWTDGSSESFNVDRSQVVLWY